MEQTKKYVNAISHMIGICIYLAGIIHLFRERKVIATLLGLTLIPIGEDIFNRSIDACNIAAGLNTKKEIEPKKTEPKMGFDMSA